MDGLTREWVQNGAIVIYTLHNSTPPVIDAWIEAARKTMESWPAQRPYLALHDFSSPKATLTSYARQRTRESIQKLPDNLARSATVISRNLFGEMIRLYVNLDVNRLHPSLQRKVFFNREEALAWLMELIPSEHSMKPPADDHFQMIYNSEKAVLYDRMVLAEDYQHHLTKFLQSYVTGKVVDIGTGTGRVSRLVKPHAKRLIALDLNFPMLQSAQQHVRGHLVQADALSLPIMSKWGDVAVEGWAFGHFRGWFADWQVLIDRALEEMTRVAKHQVLIETMGTGFLQPSPPSPGLAELFNYWETKHGFEREIIRTDYQFANLEEARELVQFFFGAELAQQMTSPELIEWTGVWRR